MYAIIETGGKQYRVQEGDVITVEKLQAEAGDTVKLDKVLVLNNDSEMKVGTPYIDGACVAAEVKENGKGDKVVIYKYKAKKDYHKKQGHRQPYTALEITSLTGKATEKKAAPAADKADSADKKASMAMKKDELISYAEERNIEIDPKDKKADILAAIEAAEK